MNWKEIEPGLSVAAHILLLLLLIAFATVGLQMLKPPVSSLEDLFVESTHAADESAPELAGER